MGFAAATVLKRSKEFEGKSVELCADELQWQEVAEAFSANQQASGLPLVSYKEAGFVTECIFWLISDDLYFRLSPTSPCYISAQQLSKPTRVLASSTMSAEGETQLESVDSAECETCEDSPAVEKPSANGKIIV